MKIRLWRVGAPLLVMAIAIVGAGLWPAHKNSEESRARIDSATADIAMLEATAYSLAPLEEESQTLVGQLVRLASLVPPDHDVSGIVVELDAVAAKVGIDLRDVVPTQSDPLDDDSITPQGWNSVVLAVRVLGEYIDIIRFVDALDDTERLVLVDRIAITGGVDGSLVGDLELRVFSATVAPVEGLARFVDEEPAS